MQPSEQRRPIPGPRPAPASEHKPLSGEQFLRLQALRIAVDAHRNHLEPEGRDVLETASTYADFIRAGRAEPAATGGDWQPLRDAVSRMDAKDGA